MWHFPARGRARFFAQTIARKARVTKDFDGQTKSPSRKKFAKHRLLQWREIITEK
jgi:hypothetical protein